MSLWQIECKFKQILIKTILYDYKFVPRNLTLDSFIIVYIQDFETIGSFQNITDVILKI